MKLEAEVVKKQREGSIVTTTSAGRDISDVYLRHPANESSSDSEGEEAPFEGPAIC